MEAFSIALFSSDLSPESVLLFVQGNVQFFQHASQNSFNLRPLLRSTATPMFLGIFFYRSTHLSVPISVLSVQTPKIEHHRLDGLWTAQIYFLERWKMRSTR